MLRLLFAFYRAIKVKLQVCKQIMGIITKVLQFVSVLTLTKCIVDLFKFLRWDGRYQFKLPFFTEQSRGMFGHMLGEIFSLSLSLIIHLHFFRQSQFCKLFSTILVCCYYFFVNTDYWVTWRTRAKLTSHQYMDQCILLLHHWLLR